MKCVQSLMPILRCPECFSGDLYLHDSESELDCGACRSRFPLVHGRPVLLRHDNELFSIDDYTKAPPSCPSISSLGRLSGLLPQPSVNLSSTRVLSHLKETLNKQGDAVVLIVGGGRQRLWLDALLGAGRTLKIVYTDIDIRADVDIFCDGHDLPFVDNCFDAVVTTAVLEHVLYPERVASEMLRVLKGGGVLYSEMPFMQQVHEGAYDFTRYTLSGHRRLFNGISVIESGMVAGPGTALVWAIENFLLSFVVSAFLRKLTKISSRLLFSWLKYFDYVLAHRPEAMDGASCTYLLGYKSENSISDREIIDGYVGAKHLRHT